MALRLVVLNDNEPSPGLVNEWGWSVLVESRYRILFDADTKPCVLEHNSRVLGVRLEGLDLAVLSHWHYDHYGGLPLIGQLNRGIPLYAPPDGKSREAHRWGFNVVNVEGPGQIVDGVWTTGPVDGFEQAIGVEASNGLVVLVGCSHPGADVLVERVLSASGYSRAYLVIGGFHYPSKRVLDRVASMTELLSPAHCSGDDAKSYVKARYPSKYLPVATGSVVEL